MDPFKKVSFEPWLLLDKTTSLEPGYGRTRTCLAMKARERDRVFYGDDGKSFLDIGIFCSLLVTLGGSLTWDAMLYA